MCIYTPLMLNRIHHTNFWSLPFQVGIRAGFDQALVHSQSLCPLPSDKVSHPRILSAVLVPVVHHTGNSLFFLATEAFFGVHFKVPSDYSFSDHSSALCIASQPPDSSSPPPDRSEPKIAPPLELPCTAASFLLLFTVVDAWGRVQPPFSLPPVSSDSPESSYFESTIGFLVGAFQHTGSVRLSCCLGFKLLCYCSGYEFFNFWDCIWCNREVYSL